MKEIFVLDKITTVESSKGPGLQVVLIPEKECYEKNIRLVFSGDNVMQVLENFDIPSSVGDTVEIDLKPKQEQTSLDGGVKDEKINKGKTGSARGQSTNSK